MAEAKAPAVEEQLLEQEQPELQEEVQEEEQVDEEQVQANPLDDEVKKWQSMYDKAQADNVKMQTAMTEYLNSQQNQQQAQDPIPQVTEEEFNPWDAYFKPDSSSFKMRHKSEQSHIHSVLDGEIQRMENKMAMNNTKNQLRTEHNMSDGDVNEFMDFISQPKDSVPVEQLVNLWRNTTGKNAQQNVQVPQTKQPTPRTAGVLQGQQPKAKSDGEKMWDSILKAGSRSNVLHNNK
tara:strand:- start:7 stop:711 length:705 start_codon:yes stop_codon:yes gene_type:complete